MVRSQLVLTSAALGFAGGIHMALAHQHFAQSAAAGLFFVGAGVAQLFLAATIALAHRPSQSRQLLASLVCMIILATWLASRTVGVPTGPHPWVPEHVGVADAGAAIAELLVVGLTAVRRDSRKPHQASGVARIVIIAALSGAVFAGALHTHPIRPLPLEISR